MAYMYMYGICEVHCTGIPYSKKNWYIKSLVVVEKCYIFEKLYIQ